MLGEEEGGTRASRLRSLIDEPPGLARADARAQRAECRARSAGQVDEGDGRLPREQIEHRIQHRSIAGAQIVRLAQLEPFRAEAAHASRSSALATIRAVLSHVGKSAAAASAPRASRRRSSSFSITIRSARVSAFTLPGSTSTPAVGGHRVHGRAARRAYDRQTVRHRLGVGHAIALEVRCQHENIGRGIQRGQLLRRDCSEKIDTSGESVPCDVRLKLGRRRRRACEIARDRQPPRQVRRSTRVQRSKCRSPCAARPPRPTKAGECRRRFLWRVLPRSVPGGATVMRSGGTS